VNADVRRVALDREVSRICHLTPSRNLVHIATGGDGLLSTLALQTAERREFHQQDLERLDGYPDYISCSIEYPNAWYLRSRRRSILGEDRLFSDWVVLTIEPTYLWQDETLFCPRNAAAQGGRLVQAGVAAFEGLFAERVRGAYDRDYVRTPLRPRACPTDEQAEVLVHRRIAFRDVLSMVTYDEAQARREYVRLTQLQVPAEQLNLAICPEFFEPYALKGLLQRGERPVEREWDHGSDA
jgi:hypothetical protein